MHGDTPRRDDKSRLGSVDQLYSLASIRLRIFGATVIRGGRKLWILSVLLLPLVAGRRYTVLAWTMPVLINSLVLSLVSLVFFKPNQVIHYLPAQFYEPVTQSILIIVKEFFRSFF
jgi:hypothetical protein